MKRRIALAAATALALLASLLVSGPPASAAVGLHVSGRNIVEANGQTFIMRGVNHPHVWFTNQTGSFANIKALGANTVRVVLGSGKRWGPSTDVANVISMCKQNRLICVLEVHDTTGFGEDGAAASLDEAVNYWISQKSALVGQENYIVINIGNEPIGNNNAGQWTSATTAAIQKMRANGFQHLLMVDGPNWGQDWQFVMRDNAQTILNADSQHNTVLSIHMYAVFNTAASITDYLNRFQTNGWPLVIGEFGWRSDSSQVDDQTVLSEAASRGLGYIGWSWSGNTDPILDMATNFDPNQLTTWGQRIFNGPNGIKATAKEATIYSGGGPADTTAPTTPGAPSASSVTSSGATLTWTASTDSGGSGLAGYNVYREQGTTDPQLGTSATNSINLTGLSPTTQYQVYVRARDGAGNLSGASQLVTFATQQGTGGGGACSVTASAQSQWSTGYVMNVTVTNTGTATSTGWSVPYSLPSGHTISSAWNATMTGGTATNVSYNGRLGPGQSASWGFQATRPSGNTQLPTLTSCTLT
jgi:mannan endo-1,4-beta-mannosidase